MDQRKATLPGAILGDLQVGEKPATRQRIHAAVGQVLPAERGDHPRDPPGRREVHALDPSVSVRAPHKDGVGLAGQLDVVGVDTPARDHPGVLATLDAGTEELRLCHGPLL